MKTYDDARTGKHLAKPGRGVVRERTLQIVLRVQARVIVHCRVGCHRWLVSRVNSVDSHWCDGDRGGNGGVGKLVVVETGHC